jgi:multidrug efflux pump subunit AcrA (membrane-fusion protein)
MPQNRQIELRSEEVQDILTRVPHWMIRWGTVLIFGIILMLFSVSWFVKYPEVIVAEVTITTNIPPEKLVAKTSGRIEAILVANKAKVIIDTPLAIIENPANYKDIFLLKKIIDSTNINGKDNNFPFEILKNKQLGDIESAFSAFHAAYITDKLNEDLHPFQIENSANSSETIEIRERLSLLQQQKSINESELLLLKNEVNRFEILFNKGVVSAQDFENKKLGYLQAQKNYKSLLSSISQLKSALIDNARNREGTRINGTKEEVSLKSKRVQSFYQLKKAIKDWELAYVLKSSIPGRVSFLQVWTESQTVNAGDNVFTIIPTNEKGYIGKVKAPALNSGKIKVGQSVNIRLANFPDSQFGVLKGKIVNISMTPDKDGNLLIDLALPQKLETSYHKIIPFQQEMVGTAEIVTEDLRLIERFFYQFRGIFTNH